MRGALVVVWMLAGCGFQIRFGDNEPPLDAPPDERPPDMMVDPDGGTCPVFYRTIGNGTYVVLDPAPFKSHMAACTSHGTHLAVIDDQSELMTLVAFGRTVAGANANSRFYVGAVQAPKQEEPDDGWIDFQDRELDEDLWASSGASQPDDGTDDNEANEQEQVAAIQLDRDALTDLPHTENVRAYCECDGIPVGPTAQSYVNVLLP